MSASLWKRCWLGEFPYDGQDVWLHVRGLNFPVGASWDDAVKLFDLDNGYTLDWRDTDDWRAR